MKYQTSALIAGISLLIIGFARAETVNTQALEAHVHGSATMQVAVDAKVLTINFSSPLDNLLGFEHKPRNQTEAKQVQNMINQFYKPTALLPSKAAQCKLKTVNLESLVIKKKNPAANVTEHTHSEGDGHADLDAELVYHCHQISNLNDLQVNLFKSFPNLHQLNVEIVSERGQTAAKLTPTKNRVTW
jgi:hypothetical protein